VVGEEGMIKIGQALFSNGLALALVLYLTPKQKENP
jgi:hypothetical protein